MKRVFKYVIGFGTTEMPVGAQILSFQSQNDLLCLWALVDPEAPREKRHFHIIGTGNDVLPGLQYIGTAQQEPFVWHLFESKSHNT